MEQYALACTNVPSAAKLSIPLSFMLYTLIGIILMLVAKRLSISGDNPPEESYRELHVGHAGPHVLPF